ncbi:MAG: photosystem II manganese-stabilizing polypeptide [Cyanobacteria bacterium P01_A01_bin.37]
MRYRSLIGLFLALCLGFLTACGGGGVSTDATLTYDDIRNTGLANSCPTLGETRRGVIPIDPSQSYVIRELCLQPTAYFVKEEPANKRVEAEFVQGKLLTRYTSSIDQVSGSLKLGSDGTLTFFEEDGFDFQASTVLLPGGEQVPFLFTIKGLVATAQVGSEGVSTSTDFKGDFKVPSYRTSNFLDPKGRGLATGYDNAVALPAQADNEELVKENVKKFETGRGTIELQITKIDSDTGEFAGVFVSEQPSDTDMGADEALEVKVEGTFYGVIETAA